MKEDIKPGTTGVLRETREINSDWIKKLKEVPKKNEDKVPAKETKKVAPFARRLKDLKDEERVASSNAVDIICDSEREAVAGYDD